MAKSRRSGIDRKNLQRTRNQARKAAYAAMAEDRKGNRKKGGASDRRAALRKKRQGKVKTQNHQAGDGPRCWNVGCRRCNPDQNSRTYQALHPRSQGEIRRARRARGSV